MRRKYWAGLPLAALMICVGGKFCLADDAMARAEALLKQGKYSEAQAVLNKIVQKDAKNASVHYLLGNALVGLGKLEPAEAEYKRTLSLDPTGQAGEYAQLALTRLSERRTPSTLSAPAQTFTAVPGRQPQDEMIARLRAECDARVAQINKDTADKIQRLNTQMKEDIASNSYLIGGRGGYRGYTTASQNIKQENSAQVDVIKQDAEKEIRKVKESYEERIKGLQ